MKRLEQQTFKRFYSREDAAADPLYIHRHKAGKKKAITILVHGLRGDRYDYWAQTPRFLFEDVKDCDIGLYHYRTGLRRIGIARSIELEHEARVFSSVLGELRDYDRIVLVTHSLGGILAKTAIYNLIAAGQETVLHRLAGVVLVACPQLGSLRAARFTRWLSPDLRALYRHNDLLKRVGDVISERVSIDGRTRPAWRFWVPMHCAIAAEDFWVDPFSASACVPSSQQSDFRNRHGDVVRPPNKDREAYRWLLRTVQSLLTRPLLHTDLHDELFVDRARRTDADEIQRIADDIFGADNVSREDVSHALVPINGALMVVRRRSITPHAVSEKVVGFTCLLPLTSDARHEVMNGTLLGKDIGKRHLAPTLESAAAIYIGAVAGVDCGSKGLAVEEVKYRLRSLAPNSRCDLVARPYSERGLALIEEFEFTPVSGESGMGALYARNIRGLELRSDAGRTRSSQDGE